MDNLKYICIHIISVLLLMQEINFIGDVYMSAIYIDSYDFQFLKDSSLGERLRFFRQRMIQYHGSDYTITSLGLRLGVTPQSISAIERGDSKNPSFLLVHKLTKEFRVPLDSVTDEFYQGEEKLFPIGIPEVADDPIIIDDEDFFLEDITVVSDDDDEEHADENFFDFDETSGLLLYHCYSKDSVEPLFHVHFKDCISDNDIQDLISRLLLETTTLSKKPFDKSRAIHPIQEAHSLMKQHKKSLSAEELLALLTNLKNTQ
jgi:transcriptional regulator with XRE-family HTH domain